MSADRHSAELCKAVHHLARLYARQPGGAQVQRAQVLLKGANRVLAAIDRVRGLPGVVAAGAVRDAPFRGSGPTGRRPAISV